MPPVKCTISYRLLGAYGNYYVHSMFNIGVPLMKPHNMHQYYLTCFLLFLGMTTFHALAQNTQIEFGKNRVQYHEDFEEWSKYESDNFITYWYGEGRFVGQAAVQLAEYDFVKIQNILEHRMNQKIQIIVYTDLTDLKQSNIGNEEAFNNTGGQTKIVGNKVFVYFDGNHNNLRIAIREGIATVYLDAMLFGSNLQEIVQNAVMMNLPPWFKDGLVSYVGNSWDTEADNALRDLLLDEEFEGFEVLAEQYPELAGRSLWYFIGEKFGASTVSNLLYLTRINRSVESGFLYVLGSSYEQVIISWTNYFKQRYLGEVKGKEDFRGKKVTFKNKRNLPVTQVKLSPDGTKLVYVLNEIGKYKVYLHNLVTDDRKVIFKSGFRNAFQATDYNYPLVDWNPNNLSVGIIYEKRDILNYWTYDVLTEKTTEEEMASRYQRVYSMEYLNPNTIVLSAAIGGYSDIVMYLTNTRQTQRITADFYDDLDATVTRIGNKRGILFASNRPDTLIQTLRLDTILPIETFDIFYYDLSTKSKELVRVTHTPLANERQPTAVDTTFFSYLSDRNGIYNREMARLEPYVHHIERVINLDDGEQIIMHIDSTLETLDTSAIDTTFLRPVIKQRAIIHQNSNFKRGILQQDASPRVSKFANLVLENNTHTIYVEPIDTSYMPSLSFSYFQIEKIKDEQKEILKEKEKSDQQQRERKKTQDNFFDIIVESQIDTADAPDPIEADPALEPEEVPADTTENNKVDIDNYLFQSEFDEEEPAIQERPTANETTVDEEQAQPANVITVPVETKVTQSIKPEEKASDVYKFRPGRITPYRLEFRTDYVTTQLDNSLLFAGLESFAANPGNFGYPPPGILLKANFKDLFEDYQFEGGIRVPTTFNGSEYFLIFDDRKKRLDKRIAVYRKTERIDLESNPVVRKKQENNIILGQYGVRYPLDIFRSIRATATLRQDRITQLATENVSLETPSITEERAGIKVEYVFDNTLDVALNIKNGTRYKIYGEVVKRFDLEIKDGVSLSFNEGVMTVLGLDARHYQRVLKHSVFATRLAAATSFGSEQMLYYLGGVDNWLFPSFNNDTPVSNEVNFAYQTLASNLRGFDVNIRNGNSFALLNAELRIPIFRYISKRIRSSFFRNFQAVGFFDVGTAWTGKDPYGQDNPLNTKVINNSDLVQVKVNFFRDPMVAGYGFGVRSMLFGYFLRLDYAWGIETRKILDPKLYLSLGMDF